MSEERKLVTILFADVTGSTALGETLDPEDVRTLMGRYYTHARRIISQYEGTLEKFIGDAVMAVFGLPRAHGNDAERALASALELREAIAGDTLLGGRLLLRMGINTGEVVATSDPSGEDFLVTGDAVNVAARLQQVANPGEIIVSERTAAAAEAAFLFDDARLIEVKGKRQPLRVFPLKGEREMRQVGRPPLVGREHDLRQLSVLQVRTLEDQRPQLVLIVAPAGTGKTRLLEEFLARVKPVDGIQVSTARCLPYGQALAYWPLHDLLMNLLGGEITHERLVDAYRRGGHSPEDAVRLTNLVLATLGIGVEREATAGRENIFTAWRLLVEALASQDPQIIIFEDLHWASESLLELVEHLLHPRVPVPLLMIVLSRPELLDRNLLWKGGGQNFTALALQPLRDVQVRELVAQLSMGLSEAMRERIVERSSGNPFFAVELVRGLVERGIAEDSTMLEAMPDTIHEALLARLDLLSTQERAVMQVASVAGRSFLLAMLQAVLDTLEPADLEAILDRLIARDLIVPDAGGMFTFRHNLIRDVAYGTLSRAERVRMHGKIAAWFEAYAADRQDEFTELITYHYREAVLLARQAAVPLDVSIDHARAVYYLERAAMLANRSGAFAEARTSLQSAIDIAPEEEHLRLYERLGGSIVVSTIQTLYSSGRWSEISDLMPMLEHMWEEAQDDASLTISVAEGYFSVLDIALAREDRAAADNAAQVLERCFPIEEVNARALLAAYREDDPGLHDIAFSSQEWIIPGLVFLSEHGIDAPRTLISQVRSWPWLSDVVMQYVEIAEALEASDLARLATAINEAETHGLIPHAARMRIVLAQRSGDRRQLERARPVLERLGDRRSLRRLEEVESLLNEREKLQ